MSSTDGEKQEWKLNGNPRRQATDALRGYMYQAWQTLHAWLDLRGDQVLCVEGAEDFDIIDEGRGVPVQVKDIQGNITLRTQCVIDAISHFWQLRKTHPDKTIEFHFLTRASIGVEKGAPFGNNRAGLTLWQESCFNPTVVIELVDFLRKDLVLTQKLSPDLLNFLLVSEPQDIHNHLIVPLKWLVDASPIEAVTHAIDRKIIKYGAEHSVPPSDCIKVTDHLLKEVLTVASRKDINERQLEFADFATIFEKMTSVNVPRNQLNTLLAIQNGLGIPMPLGGASVLFQVGGAVFASYSLPPLAPAIAPRQKLVEQCKSILMSETFLFISGSTGMGKSTLAKLTARLFGGDWAWFSFSSFHEEHYISALGLAARAIDDLPHDTNIILDDLLLDSRSVPKWEQILAGVFYTVRARQIRVVVTSRRSIPIRLRSILGIAALTEYVVPDFDETEIKEFCVQLGCQGDEQASKHARLAFIQTSGHPQLIHARLLTLSRQGWPQVKFDSLLETPEDIGDQQSQARQLLSSLTPDEKELLYRASIAVGPFRREHIVLLGEDAKISFPGDIFDGLVGPWIKKSEEGLFELSQLLRNAAVAVWSTKTRESIHSGMAKAILSTKSLTIRDGSSALFHAFVGKNDWALMALANSLMTNASVEVQKAIAESVSWFFLIQVGSAKGQLYPSNPNISLMLRMLQFRLSVTIKSDENVFKILDAWEAEVKHLDDSPVNLLCRGLFLFSVILYSQGTLSCTRVLELFESLASLRTLLLKPENRELIGPCPFVKMEEDGVSISVFAKIFGINSITCKSKDDLAELLTGLSRLNSDLRDELLGAFNLPDGYASAYVSGVYLNEDQASRPDWQSCVDIFSKAIDCAITWGCPGLGAVAVKAVAVVTEEEFHHSDEAIAILDGGTERFPSHAWILQEYRGTVLLRAERYQEALSVFNEVLKGFEDAGRSRSFLFNPLFSFRNAGIAAANVDSWDKSAGFFHRGSRCAENMRDSVWVAAFQTDAAYAYWKAEMPKEMLSSLRSSIDLIDAMNRDKTDLGAFWVFRVTAQVLCWIRNLVEKGQLYPELAVPMPGMCSNPSRNKEILTLPDVPFELTLYFLVCLEKALKMAPLALTKYGPRLDRVSIPVVSMFMSEFRIGEAFTSGQFNDLPILLDKHIRAYLSSRQLVSEGKRPWDVAEVPVSDEQFMKALEKEALLENTFLVALFMVCSLVTVDACAGQIDEWRKSAKVLSWESNLIRYLDRAEAVLQSSPTDLAMVLNDKTTLTMDRLLASVFISNVPSDFGLRDLLQAHVFLLDYFSQSCVWGKYIENPLSAVIASTWAQRAKARFSLKTPQLTVPPLEAACSDPIDSFKKAGVIILLAAHASGINMPEVLIERYREL